MSQPPKAVCDTVDQRDNYQCVICGKSLYTTYGSRHHRRMRSHSNKKHVHDVANLILVCGSGTTGCHGRIHANPAQSYANGWLVHSWQNPEETPITTREGVLLLDNNGNKHYYSKEQSEYQN